jgi:hypothetical protein
MLGHPCRALVAVAAQLDARFKDLRSDDIVRFQEMVCDVITFGETLVFKAAPVVVPTQFEADMQRLLGTIESHHQQAGVVTTALTDRLIRTEQLLQQLLARSIAPRSDFQVQVSPADIALDQLGAGDAASQNRGLIEGSNFVPSRSDAGEMDFQGLMSWDDQLPNSSISAGEACTRLSPRTGLLGEKSQPDFPVKKRVRDEAGPAERRCPIWDPIKKRKIAGAAAPAEQNLREYFLKNPTYELYVAQDRNCDASQPTKIIPLTPAIIVETSPLHPLDPLDPPSYLLERPCYSHGALFADLGTQ